MNRDFGVSIWLVGSLLHLSLAYSELGDLENARGYAEKALELAQKEGHRWLAGASLTQLGRTLGKIDKSQLAQGEQYISRGMKILDEMKARISYLQGYLFLGQLYADVGKREKAVESLKKAETEFSEMGMDYWLRRTQEVLEKLQG